MRFQTDAASEAQYLTDAIYEAGLDPARWSTTLVELADFFGAAGADIYIGDGGHYDIAGFCGISDDLIQQYLSHYHADNLFVDAIIAAPQGAVLRNIDCVDEQTIRRSPYFQDFLYKNGFGLGTAVSLLSDGQARGFAGFHYRRDADAFSAQNLERIRLLTPHLHRAARLTLRLRRTFSREALLEDALDQLAAGVIALDTRGRVLHMNYVAEDLINRHPGVAVQRGHLQASRSAEQARLNAAIDAVLASDFGLKRYQSSVKIDAVDTHPVLTLLVAPVSRLRRAESSLGALVVVSDGRLPQAERVGAALRAIYRLTPAEADLALHLADGLTVGEYADLRSLSIETVRTMTKRILAKTSTRRQAQLVQLITQRFGLT